MDLNEFRNELKSLKNFRSSGNEPNRVEPAEMDIDTDQLQALSDPARNAIDIEAYCDLVSASKSEVWQRVKRGELLAKHQNGRLLILDPATRSDPGLDLIDEAPAIPRRAAASSKSLPAAQILPALPSAADRTGFVEGRESVELALLIDHLSLAKDENREIIRMAQDSIDRISAMAEKVVAAKEAVLIEREARLAEQSHLLNSQKDQIELLKHRLKSQEVDLLKLRRDVEDLEILAQSLSSDS